MDQNTRATLQAKFAPSTTVNTMPEYYPKEFFDETQIDEEYNSSFVLTPFAPSFSEIYSTIKSAVQKLGMTCSRSDDFYQSGRVMNTVLENIKRAEIIIADLTMRNANVFYELGIAHSIKGNVILLAQDAGDVPFDLRDFHMIIYENTAIGKRKLKMDIIKAINQLRGEQQRAHYTKVIRVEDIRDARQIDYTHWVIKAKPDSHTVKGIQRVVQGTLTQKIDNTFLGLELQCDIHTDKWYRQEIVSVHEDGSWQVCPEFGGVEHRVRFTLKKGPTTMDRLDIFVTVLKER